MSYKPNIDDMRWGETAAGSLAVNIAAPGAGQRDTGWAVGQTASSRLQNYWQHQAYLWAKYTDGLNLVSTAHYGTTGGGSNDTVALQAALDDNVGRPIILPPGVYLTDELTMGAGTTLIGYGATLKKRTLPNSNAVTLRIMGDDCTVEGINFDTNALSGYQLRVGDGTETVPYRNFTARALTMELNHRTAKGIFVGLHERALIEGCYLENSLALADAPDVLTFGIAVFSGGTFGSEQFSDGCAIRRNTVVGFYDGIESYGSGIRLGLVVEDNDVSGAQNRGIFTYHATGGRVVNNRVTDCHAGIYADSSASSGGIADGNVVSHNTVRGCATFGICVEEHISATISINTCIENQDGLILAGDCVGTTVTANVLTRNTRYGLWLDKEQSPPKGFCHDLTITGNTVRFNGEDGMRLGGIGRSNTVSNNTCTDNGTSAATRAGSAFAGIWIGDDSVGLASATVLASGNILGNDPVDATGKQGYGIFLEAGGYTKLVAGANHFRNCGQSNIFGTTGTVRLLGNEYDNGTNSLTGVTIASSTP